MIRVPFPWARLSWRARRIYNIPSLWLDIGCVEPEHPYVRDFLAWTIQMGLGAPKMKRDEFLQGLRQLRELGIVEPE